VAARWAAPSSVTCSAAVTTAPAAPPPSTVAGAVIGAVIASHTHGQEVALPAGTVVDLALADAVHVLVRD
jgi:hypothetical protein